MQDLQEPLLLRQGVGLPSELTLRQHPGPAAPVGNL